MAGGDGGSAREDAAGGNGAAVSLSDSVTFSGRVIDVSQTASGGDGGSVQSGVLGEAGAAHSEFSFVDQLEEGSLILRAIAAGGNGGDRAQTEHGRDITSFYGFQVFTLVCVHANYNTNTLFLVIGTVQQPGSCLQNTRVNAEVS